MQARGAVLDEAGARHTGPLALVELQNGDNPPSYVAGTENFYAITRYNWSSYYADGRDRAGPGWPLRAVDSPRAMTDPHLPALPATAPGLYRHYKGGWYEVVATARCSETLQGMTLYRPLYGAGLTDGAPWVRPAAMFHETGLFGGKVQPRFMRHDPAQVALTDLPTARALIAHLRAFGRTARRHRAGPGRARATARAHHLLRTRLQRLRLGRLLHRPAPLGGDAIAFPAAQRVCLRGLRNGTTGAYPDPLSRPHAAKTGTMRE